VARRTLELRNQEAAMAEKPEPNRFTHLPERVKPEQLRTSKESRRVPEEKEDGLRETEWFLRTSGA
jgi:hypothetical protein